LMEVEIQMRLSQDKEVNIWELQKRCSSVQVTIVNQ
jgi:hypothetical protein